MRFRCRIGIHEYREFLKEFKVEGFSQIRTYSLRRRECIHCGKYQGKTAYRRDHWSAADKNEGDTLYVSSGRTTKAKGLPFI